MIANKKLIGSALCLATTLFAANIATAQSANANPAAGAKAATPEAIFDRWDKDKNKREEKYIYFLLTCYIQDMHHKNEKRGNLF